MDVVGGDTIKVAKLGGPAPVESITVRLIGIDTPETRKPATPIECGGKQATAAMLTRTFPTPADTDADGLVDTEGGEGREVKLATDQTQDLYDSFGRLLAYAIVGATDLGRAMVADGWADVFVFERDFRRVDSYREAQLDAETGRLGVWGACGGNFHTPI